MDNIFLAALMIYILIFAAIGIIDARKVRNFSDYAVAGKNQGTWTVIMTLLATVLGASTTIGITDTVNGIGFPGIWWIAFGAIGLILQSVFLSEKVRSLNADTLPSLAGILVGKSAETILALVIVISWVGVIAGQLVAMSGVMEFALGHSSKTVFIIVSVFVIGYTLVGGQLSVVKTDRIQFIIILAGIIFACLYLYIVKGDASGEVINNIELLNDNYRPVNLLTQLFVIGGVYFLGPDIMSRNFLSRDGKTAKKSAWTAGIILLIFAIIITLIGMWVRFNITAEELGGMKALMYVAGILPKWVSVILIFGLLSAILSSTDTCIINASSIFVKNILRRDSVLLVRITVAVIGILAIIIALLGKGDIISLLSGAYSIYTPGVIFPLLVAVIAHGKKEINKVIWVASVILGGLFGIAGTYFVHILISIGVSEWVMRYLTLIGMGISLVVSLCSLRPNSHMENK